jgi:peptide/nickel transport system permease protein
VTGYLVRRVAQAVVVLLLVTVVVFVLVHLVPGGPARALLGPRASPQQVRAFVVANGYDRPLYVQYGHYLWQLLHGNLGFSYHYNQSVASLLGEDLPKSALLVGLSVAVAVVVAVPLGVLQAVRRNRPVDYALTGASFFFYSMPVFWLGIVLVMVFAVDLHVLPPEGPQGATVGAVLRQPTALVLPVFTLSLITIASFSRYMRSSMLDQLAEDYVRTARAKGLSEHAVLFRHLLRNALVPIVTLLGLSLPSILSGALVTESVFNYPGMGLLFWNAATTKDYPVLLGFTLVVGVATVAGSLLADLAYAWLDPRIRYT